MPHKCTCKTKAKKAKKCCGDNYRCQHMKCPNIPNDKKKVKKKRGRGKGTKNKAVSKLHFLK